DLPRAPRPRPPHQGASTPPPSARRAARPPRAASPAGSSPVPALPAPPAGCRARRRAPPTPPSPVLPPGPRASPGKTGEDALPLRETPPAPRRRSRAGERRRTRGPPPWWTQNARPAVKPRRGSGRKALPRPGAAPRGLARAPAGALEGGKKEDSPGLPLLRAGRRRPRQVPVEIGPAAAREDGPHPLDHPQVNPLGDHRFLLGHFRRGDLPPRIDDHRPAKVLQLAAFPDAVRRHHPHLILDGPGLEERLPVHGAGMGKLRRHEEDLGALQGEAARHFRKADVKADEPAGDGAVN